IGQALVLQEQQPILAQAHQQGFDSRHRPPHRWFPNHVGSIVTATGNFWAHGWCHYDIKRLHTRAIIAAHMFCLGAAMSATIIMEPDVQQKLAILGDEASDEVTDAAADQHLKHPTSLIYNAKQERGGTTRLFKVLQTNSCRYACKYCFTSCAIRRKPPTFKPDQLATTFVPLQREKRVDGLFLSSGIVPDANTTMEKMLATVERLRLREGYTGYIHLKLIPGADFEYIERAVELADRVSLN